jgi:hypothetical protein
LFSSLLFLAPILARAAVYAVGNDPRSWRDADWSSTGMLPAAASFAPARVVIFTGTAGAWKGVFSVHSWIVLKRADEKRWTRYDVVGWGEPVRLNNWPVDGLWYGNKPVMLADITGAEAETLIPRIEKAVKAYDYAQTGDYRIWPGPNSNSFTAAILLTVPELGVALPPNAIGRDFRHGFYAGRTDSGSGLDQSQWLCRHQGRLDRRHRTECPWPGGRSRPALPRPEAAGLWSYRHCISGHNRAGTMNPAGFLTFV